MKTAKLFFYLLLVTLVPRFALADLVGPYTADANTLFLIHFDEAAGGTSAANAGSKGRNFYSVDETTGVALPPTVSTMLGAAGYVNGATNFHNCMTNPATGYVFGFDTTGDNIYQGEGPAPAGDAIVMTNLNIGNGGQTPFTIEALIKPTTLAANEEIVCTDNSSGSRGFQFRITGGSLQFQFITGSQAVSGTIPTTGADAFVAGTWYHVAVVYNGTTATLYWTKLDPANGAAHVLSSASLAIGTTQGAVVSPLCIGNENRNVAGEQFLGSIDEVRISSVARAANQMQFFSPLVTITQNPVSQNIDYNQPVNFSVGASSLTALGYQWRYNSNSIAGFTNSSFTITNVAASNAGYYDCIVTNTAGYAATSSPALLVVGAANFLANRYSFTTDTSDSIGGQWGTNFGNATVTGGKLVLDGTSGTYMQLPPNLYNGGNATALTFEFWATYGSNPANVYTFAFGVTNFVINQGIVGFNHAMYSPHTGSGGQTASATPGDPLFSQTVSAAGNLDGRTVHVAVVFDPPNKLLSIYTNGVLEAVNTNFTVNISSLNDQMSFIGRSLWASDPYLNASIDELRIFKGALSPITIKQSDDQGPNTLLADGPGKFVLQPANTSIPAGQTATFTAAAVGYLPLTYQWFRGGSLISGATNATYSFATVLGDNGATFNVHATNTIGVTTYVTNSTTATLTVFVPPTLTWYGYANNLWNTSDANWNSGSGPIAFTQTNGVLFDNNGSGQPTVDIGQSVVPYNITVNAASDYLLTSSSTVGSLDGQGSMTKLNTDTLTIDLTNNLSGPLLISAGKVQVGNFDSFGTLGTGAVTNNATLSFARGDTALVVPNNIHGSGTVSVDGGGTVTFTGNSDYSGSTILNSGIAIQQSSAAFGATSSGTTVANGAQLYITANVNTAEGLTLNGVGGDGNGALRKGGAGVTTNSGAISLATDSTIGIDTGSTLVLGNVVSGSGVLTATGSGVLMLNTNNTFNNGFTLNGSTVNVNANRALGSGLVTIGGAGHFVFADGLTVTNPFLATFINPGTSTGLMMVNDNTNGTVTTLAGWMEFDATPTLGGDFIGPISSGYLNVTGPITNTATGLVSSRNGFVRFSGGGNYTTFTVNQGTVSIGANNGLSTNAALVVAGSAAATFDLNGFNQTLAGLSDGAANAELLTNSTATLSTLTLNSAGNTYSGVIAGKVALVQNGPGNLYLAGTNSYTGNTTVNGGTLELAQPGLAASSTVTVASGAILQLDFSTTNQVAGLILNGASQPLGVYNSASSPAYITGAGSLLVAQSVALNRTNITTTVSGGNLILSWPLDHKGWRLQAQTNSLATGLGTNWVDVPNTANVTAVTNAINPASGSVFYRMVYP